MTSFEPIENDSLHMGVINSIITAIATGVLKPGEKIIEQNIAEKLKISRAPVREAIRELSAQGIIDFTPRKGAAVAELTLQNIKEAYSLRACLEGMAINLAVENIKNADLHKLESLSKKMTKNLKDKDVEDFIKNDVAFHDLIRLRSNHLKLQRLLNSLILQTKLYMLMSKHNLFVNSKLDLEYGVHESIVLAIRNKNKEEAEAEMKKHINNAGDTLIRFLKQK